MNREQVKMAMGGPHDRLRETENGLETSKPRTGSMACRLVKSPSSRSPTAR